MRIAIPTGLPMPYISDGFVLIRTLAQGNKANQKKTKLYGNFALIKHQHKVKLLLKSYLKLKEACFWIRIL